MGCSTLTFLRDHEKNVTHFEGIKVDANVAGSLFWKHFPGKKIVPKVWIPVSYQLGFVSLVIFLTDSTLVNHHEKIPTIWGICLLFQAS